MLSASFQFAFKNDMKPTLLFPFYHAKTHHNNPKNNRIRPLNAATKKISFFLIRESNYHRSARLCITIIRNNVHKKHTCGQKRFGISPCKWEEERSIVLD